VTTDDPTRQWCADAAAVLGAAAFAAGRLAAAVAVDWLDDHGREWSDRISSLGRELADASRRAEDLAERLGDLDPARPELANALTSALQSATGTARASGPRLGDTAGARVDDGYGVRIAEIPDPP